MKVDRYRKEIHGEYLPDVHRKYYSEPAEIEEFENAVEEAFEQLNDILEFRKDIKVVVASTDEDEISDEAPDDYYFHGFSFADGMRGHEGCAIFIRASTHFDWWSSAFKDMLIHEAAHQIFYRRDNQDNWEDNQYFSIMFEGHAENVAASVNEKFDYDWNPVWRKEQPLNLDKEKLYLSLKKQRRFGDADDNKDHDLFLSGGENWSDAEGYTIAYQIVKLLLEREMIELNNFINSDGEEWKEKVDNAIEELY